MEPGSKLPLELQVADGNAGLFPSAVVRKSDGSTISGSPFILNHVANGLYKPSTLPVMPDDDYVSVQYLIYSDAGRTTLSTEYGLAHETIARDTDDAALIQQIVDVVSLLVARSSTNNARAAKVVRISS